MNTPALVSGGLKWRKKNEYSINAPRGYESHSRRRLR
jgi:hypothetical protein